MVKKDMKKQQRKLAVELVKKRRMTKPAVGRAENNTFHHVKDKQMRSELTDKQKREKIKAQKQVRKGRKEAEERGENPEDLGFPARKDPSTIEKMRVEDETLVTEEGIEEVQGEDDVDEFDKYFKGDVTPKIMVTTCRNPSAKLFNLLKELCSVIPNMEYYKRKGYELKKIVEYAKDRQYTALMVFSEKSKVPDGIYICSLPDGPTTFWRMTNLKLGAEMKHGTNCNESDAPELILNNFVTRLGRRTARQLASLFPQKPEFKGRRTVTFHNQRDFVFFRHYRYQFKGERESKFNKPEEEEDEADPRTSMLGEEGKSADDLDDMLDDDDLDESESNYKDKSMRKNKEMREKEAAKELERCALQEIGPRFTLKMRYLQHGTFDAKNGEYEYMWRPDSQVSRKKFHL